MSSKSLWEKSGSIAQQFWQNGKADFPEMIIVIEHILPHNSAGIAWRDGGGLEKKGRFHFGASFLYR